MAAGYDGPSVEVNLDVVPVRKGLGYLAVGRLVGGSQILECRVGEYDTPPESVERPIAFEHSNLPGRESLLDQYAEVETCRTASNAGDSELPGSGH